MKKEVSLNMDIFITIKSLICPKNTNNKGLKAIKRRVVSILPQKKLQYSKK